MGFNGQAIGRRTQAYLGFYATFMYKNLPVSNLVLRTTKMTPVKPQISKFKAEKSCQVAKWVLTCHGGPSSLLKSVC